MSTLIEDGSRAADLNLLFSLLSSFSNRQEMLCCHVTVFTVCWQKCNFERPISLSCHSRQEIVRLISDNKDYVMCLGGFVQNDV